MSLDLDQVGYIEKGNNQPDGQKEAIFTITLPEGWSKIRYFFRKPTYMHMHKDDLTRIMKLNWFTREKARLVTTDKVIFTVEPYWERGPSGGLIGAKLYFCMREQFGTEQVGIEIWHLVQMAKWFFDIFKDCTESIEKTICHELAHIAVPEKHNEDFKTYARFLGAVEFTEEAAHIIRSDNIWLVRFLLALGRGDILIPKRLRK